MRFRRATSVDRGDAAALFAEVGFQPESAYAAGSLLAWSTMIRVFDVTLAEARHPSADEWSLVAVILSEDRGARVRVIHRALLGNGGRTYVPIQLRAIARELTRRRREGAMLRGPRTDVEYIPAVEGRKKA